MKTAIGYIRISTRDQSRHSLAAQEREIREYASRNDIELLQLYKDAGESAKNFDRPDWVQLYDFIKRNHKQIDLLLVAKFDRFSRNLKEALIEIEKLEKKYHISIVAVNEPIEVKPDDPVSKMMRTQILMNGEFELETIKYRTKNGLHQGALSGRHVNRAPYGYKSERRADRNSYLVIDPEPAKIVQAIFSMYLLGMGIAEVARQVKDMGYKHKGNSAIQRVLHNYVYAGLVKVPAFRGEPERLTKGIHEALISEKQFYRVQEMLSGRTNIIHTKENIDVPLRGALKCNCGKLFTAGNSKGRNKYYWYYVCHDDKRNLSANKLHKQFNGILETLSFSQNDILSVSIQLKRLYELQQKTTGQTIAARERELQDIEQKIEGLEEKYIMENAIDTTTYKKYLIKLNSQKSDIEDKINTVRMASGNNWQSYISAIPAFADLKHLYNSASVTRKHMFLNIVFDNQLYYANDIYRTTFLLGIFKQKALQLKGMGLLEYQQPQPILGVTPVRSERGS